MGSAGNILSTNKDMIKNTADVIGNVAKAGAKTASAVKQIVDEVKAKRAAVGTTKGLVKPLSEKSLDFFNTSRVLKPRAQAWCQQVSTIKSLVQDIRQLNLDVIQIAHAIRL